jgi:hypothetical protein
MKFIVRPAFWLDLDRHHLWLTRHAGEAIADRWLEALWETVFFLRDNPELGRLRHDLKQPGVRSWLVTGFKRWTLFYGLRDGNLVLYRVEGGETNLRGLVIG